MYLEREIDARTKVVSALVYPGIVIAMSIGTVLILAVMVLPQFKKVVSVEYRRAQLEMAKEALAAPKIEKALA